MGHKPGERVQEAAYVAIFFSLWIILTPACSAILLGLLDAVLPRLGPGTEGQEISGLNFGSDISGVTSSNATSTGMSQ
jgi:hypothetical protein